MQQGRSRYYVNLMVIYKVNPKSISVNNLSAHIICIFTRMVIIPMTKIIFNGILHTGVDTKTTQLYLQCMKQTPLNVVVVMLYTCTIRFNLLSLIFHIHFYTKLDFLNPWEIGYNRRTRALLKKNTLGRFTHSGRRRKQVFQIQIQYITTNTFIIIIIHFFKYQ